MKKLLMSAAVISMIAGGFTSCKKGKEDPFITFRSRDGRITGTWELASYDETTTTNQKVSTSNTVNGDTYESTSVVTETDSYDGSTWTEKVVTDFESTDSYKSYDAVDSEWKSETNEQETDITEITKSNYSVKVSIYKNNTYVAEFMSEEKSYEKDQTSVYNGTGTTTTQDTTYSPASSETWTDDGEWYWMDSRKTKIAINAGPMQGNVLQLKYKEVIIEDNTSEMDNDVDTDPLYGESTYDDNDPFDTDDGIETTETNTTTETTMTQTWEKTDTESKREDSGSDE